MTRKRKRQSEHLRKDESNGRITNVADSGSRRGKGSNVNGHGNTGANTGGGPDAIPEASRPRRREADAEPSALPPQPEAQPPPPPPPPPPKLSRLPKCMSYFPLLKGREKKKKKERHAVLKPIFIPLIKMALLGKRERKFFAAEKSIGFFL
jgi:hypothetical protein